MKRIFYIYTEASLAVFFGCFAILEALLFAYFTNQHFALMQVLTGTGGIAFFFASLYNVIYVYKKVNNNEA